MTTLQLTHAYSNPSDIQISALLGQVSTHCSIVDKLMSMPAAETGGGSEWDRAVARRLERKLADAMRGLIEGDVRQHTA